jgi:hypothetical protein
LILISWKWYNSNYKTYSDAVIDGGIQRGWVPTFVPKDAYDIEEWHVISPQEHTLKFKYISLENFEELIKKYKHTPFGKALETKEITADDIKFIPASVDKLTAKYYRIPNSYVTASCLINDKKHKTAYFSSEGLKEPLQASP